MYQKSPLFLLCCACLLAAAGCQNKEAGAPTSELPAIPVAHPRDEMVTDYEAFTGRTDAVEVVDVRARVTGYLSKPRFREGSEVQKDDLLFEIDPRPYQAQLDNATSQVDLNEASLKLAKTTYERDLAIARAVAGALSQQQLDQDVAAVEEAKARIQSAKASTEVYKLNLEFCRVTSPITGQVSRYYLTKGNLVNIDQTLLTTIVSLNPMHVYFDMDEPTLLRIRRAISDGRINLPEDGVMPVEMGLQGEDDYPHKGAIDFLNNQVNSSTGSITLRGVFANPRSRGDVPELAATTVGLLAAPLGVGPLLALPAPVPGRTRLGTRLLSPGMYARVRLPIGEAHKAILIKDSVIQADQGLKKVYVVDADNKVQERRVTTGPLQKNGLRVVTGVGADEWVVIGGLQQVRPKMEVTPEQHEMPELNSQAGPAAVTDKETRKPVDRETGRQGSKGRK